MMRCLRFTLAIFGVGCITLSLAGCDGYIRMEGRVYEWNGPASKILVDHLDEVLPPELTPLEGAEITVEHWTPDRRETNTNGELWINRATSDKFGHFKTGSTAAPFEFDATISVVADGYEPAEKVFRHGDDGFDHIAIILLARPKRPPLPDSAELQWEVEANPAQDLSDAIRRDDLRFIGVHTFVTEVPGVFDYWEVYRSSYGLRVIPGTSDTPAAEEGARLHQARQYAQEYNLLLLQHLATRRDSP